MKFGEIYVGNGSSPNQDSFFVTYVHHDGESHWMNKEQIMGRIQMIRTTKPENEVHPRLRKMRIYAWSKVLAQASKAYNEAKAQAWKTYDEVVAPAWKVFAKNLPKHSLTSLEFEKQVKTK